jgi:hypothetical protein
MLCIKLLESIGLLPSAYMGLFLVYLKTLRLLYISFFLNFSIGKNGLLHPTDVKFNPWILQEI